MRKFTFLLFLLLSTVCALAAKPKINIEQVTVKTGVTYNDKKSIEVQVDYSEAGSGSEWVNFTLWFRDASNNYKKLRGASRSREGYDCFRKSEYVVKGIRNQHVNFKIPVEDLQLSAGEKTLQALVTVDADKQADMSKKFLGSCYAFPVDLEKKYSYLQSGNPVIIPDPKPAEPQLASKAPAKSTVTASTATKTTPRNTATKTTTTTTTKTSTASRPAASPQKPSATISKVWIEHNQNVNGRTAMKVHCAFNVKGMKGKKGNMNIWIRDKNGKFIRINNASTNTEGTTFVPLTFTPNYESTDFNNAYNSVFIGDINFHPGSNQYDAVVTINDPAGRILAQSSAAFTGTGSSNMANNRPANNHPANSNVNRNQGNSGGNVVKTWREDLGGGFVICKQFANGNIMRTRYRPCPNCRGAKSCASCYGRGICSICSGQGGIISAGYGNFYPCAMCNRTGKCNLCQGTGRCGCTKLDYPGYAIGSTAVITANGQVYKDNAEYNNYNSSSRNNNNSGSGRSSSTCSNCHGTGVESNRMYVNDPSGAAANTSGQVGYTNLKGTKCKYCHYNDGDYTYHVHLKCYKCRR